MGNSLMYAIATIDKTVAEKMLGEKLVVKYDSEEKLIAEIKNGRTEFLDKELDVRIDGAGEVSKGFGLLKAVAKTDTPVKAYLSFALPGVVRRFYPEILKQYGKVIPAKLKAAMSGKSDDPFKIDITPEIASALILLNANNRTIKSNYVDKYARDMKAGVWKGANGSIITIDKSGVLTNGQHRLLACILMNYTMENMVVQGCVEADENMDTGAKRTIRDNIKSKYGKEAKNIDVTNLLYRIVANENYTPVTSIGIPLYFRYENDLLDFPVFRATKVDVTINAPYKTAFLIMLESGEFSRELLIKVHKLLNNGALTGSAFDQEILNLKKRMNEKKAEFSTVGVSSAENQKLIVYCMIATIVPALRGEKRWKINGKKGNAITNVREFIMESCGNEVKKIIEENS